MFNYCPALCRPNAAEQTQIAKTPGINWVSDVPAGQDCCTWSPAAPPVFLGDKQVKKMYLGSKEVKTGLTH